MTKQFPAISSWFLSFSDHRFVSGLAVQGVPDWVDSMARSIKVAASHWRLMVGVKWLLKGLLNDPSQKNMNNNNNNNNNI